MLEVLNSSFIHIVLPEKSTQKQTYKMFEPRSRLSYVMLVHFSIMNTFHQKIKKKLMHLTTQQQSNIDNNKEH